MSRTPVSRDDDKRPPAEDTPDRVLRAAYACFAEAGIAKTTIEDIASRARVSRPTVYKYFPGKDAILDEISMRETRKVNAQVRARVVRHAAFADFLTDVLLLVVRLAASNPYIRRMVESHEFQVQAMRASSPMFELQRQWWSGVLSHAADRGELAADLDRDEIIAWLTHTQSLLLAYVEDPAVSDGALRRMIERFVVEPLLADANHVRAR